MRGRIRSVKPELFSDEKLWDLGQETGLPVLQGFEGLWCMADREGRFEWRPRALKSAVLPYWDGDFSRVLDALATRGFIVRYEVDGRVYGAVTNFLKHQTPNNRELASTIPPPPESTINTAKSTRGARVNHASSTPARTDTSENKSSGNGILGTGSWEGEALAAREGGAAAPAPQESDSTTGPAEKPASRGDVARRALSNAIRTLASDHGHDAPPTASRAHLAAGASKVSALIKSGTEPAEAASRVASAAYRLLATGKASSFGWALNDCVIGAAGCRARDVRRGFVDPAPASAFTNPTDLDRIFGPETPAAGSDA